MALTFVFACVGCGSSDGNASDAENTDSVSTETTETADTAETEDNSDAEAETTDTTEAEDTSLAETETTDAEGVMTYEEYVAAALDTEVIIEAYVQAKQAWWEDQATVYAQDEDGAYFLYNMACSEEDYAKLTPERKLK